jgi:hypothetical protein
VILAANDVIWGNHTNVGRFAVPPGTTVTVRSFDGSAPSGMLEVHAVDIVVSGTLTAGGAGYWGGAGGGAGGGASVYGFTGVLLPGHGGVGGSGLGLAGNGSTGADGWGAFAFSAPGGNGAPGGAGGGPGAGLAGGGGIAVWSSQGGPGYIGDDGGYLIRAGNGDHTTDVNVFAGSGGGGGGGGAGGGAGLPGVVGKIVGGGGGSGATGANGGGAIKLFADNSLRVVGTIDTRGANNGVGGNTGADGIITLTSAIGGQGANGANSSMLPGTGAGGLPGHGLADRATGLGYNGGNGARGGRGGGGGILLHCTTDDGMDLTSGTLDARGGGGNVVSGGTVKIFFAGTDPTTGTVTILAGRLFTVQGAFVLPAQRWELYR